MRKTKEDALATRSRIIDAAERLFQAHGVAGTSLQQVATEAGVTRGAVYWHFTDKSDLFNAMIDRVCLPMEEDTLLLGPAKKAPPGAALPALRAQLLGIFSRVQAEPQAQRVFDIALHKVEYVGELIAVRDRRLQIRRNFRAILERTLRQAQRRGEIVARPPATQIALGLHALLDGLLQNWMLEPTAFNLLAVGTRAVDVYLAGLTTATPPPARAALGAG